MERVDAYRSSVPILSVHCWSVDHTRVWTSTGGGGNKETFVFEGCEACVDYLRTRLVPERFAPLPSVHHPNPRSPATHRGLLPDRRPDLSFYKSQDAGDHCCCTAPNLLDCNDQDRGTWFCSWRPDERGKFGFLRRSTSFWSTRLEAGKGLRSGRYT